MRIIADLHTHSIASEHAYSSIGEMAASAAQKGLYALAVTDHFGGMPGAPGSIYFDNLNQVVPRQYKGVQLICGAEANILNFQGEIDLPPVLADRLDWVVASIHHLRNLDLENPTPARCTELWLAVAENPMVRVIGHSGSPAYAYDYETVIPVFGRQGKLVEINAASFWIRKESIPNCRKIAEACKKHQVPIVVNSDAHIETDVAAFGAALDMLRDMDFPEELVVNGSRDRLDAYLRQYTRFFSRARKG